MIKPNPFTPKSGQEPKVFLDRENEILFFEKRLNELSNGSTNHYILNGSWGIGKTSLLKYFKLLAQEKGFSCVYFPAQEFPEHVDDKEITIHMLQSISRGMPLQFNKSSRIVKSLEGFGVQVLGTGFQISFHLDKNTVLDSQTLLLEGLVNLWKELKNSKGVAVLIDDVQNFNKVTRYLTTIKNVLSLDELTKNTKYLFILSSTIEGWRPFLERNHPIGRFFIPRQELQSLDKDTTHKLIEETLKDTGVSFDTKLYHFIWQHTHGHPFEIHSLCRSLYDLQERNVVTFEKAAFAMETSLAYLGNSIFDQMLFGISEREMDILHSVSFFDQPATIQQIQQRMEKHNLETTGIHQYLRRLVEKSVVINPKRGMYHIEDSFLRLYIQKK